MKISGGLLGMVYFQVVYIDIQIYFKVSVELNWYSRERDGLNDLGIVVLRST